MSNSNPKFIREAVYLIVIEFESNPIVSSLRIDIDFFFTYFSLNIKIGCKVYNDRVKRYRKFKKMLPLIIKVMCKSKLIVYNLR